MLWVREDYQAIADLIAAANKLPQTETALEPGRLVRRLRRGLQISQQKLADMARVPRSLLERLEAGRDVQLSSLKRVMAALGCKPVILPASESLLAEFRRRLAEERSRDRKLTAVFRRMDERRTAAAASPVYGSDPVSGPNWPRGQRDPQKGP